MAVLIGLDIGGTKIMVAAADGEGTILRRKRTATATTLEEDLANINKMIAEVAADIEPTLEKAQKDCGDACVLIDFFPADFTLLLQFFQRTPERSKELKNNRCRDIRHDSQAKDGCLVQLAGAKYGHRPQQICKAPLLASLRGHPRLVDNRQRHLPADAVNCEQQ